MSDNQASSISILLVEPDDDVRPLLTENLISQGYQVTTELNEAAAIARAKLDPGFDLILANQYQSSLAEAIAMGQRIRAAAGIAEQVPVVVLAEHYGEDLEGQNHHWGSSSYVAYLSDGQQLWQLIDQLCQ